MTHKKEWRTCDRCGKEVKEFNSWNIPILTRFSQPINIKMKSEEVDTYTNDCYIEKINEEYAVKNVQLTTYCRGKKREFDLCSDCKEDFIKFMNGVEKNDLEKC